MKNIIACILLLFLILPTNVFAIEPDIRKGDIIEINGVKAIVFRLDEYGNGTAMTIKALRGVKKAWCRDNKFLNDLSSDSTIDGYANTQAIYDYCSDNKISLSMFPAFAWCKSLGEGWYIPSEEQLKDFIDFWLGNEQEYNWDDEDEGTGLDLNAASPKEINEKIMMSGGTPFFTGVYTSTKDSKNKITIYSYDENKKTWRFKMVSNSSISSSVNGRAFYDF